MPPETNTKEATKEQQRLYKKRRRIQIKNDPELLAIAKEKRRSKYINDKVAKKIKNINELSSRSQREQRKRWRENTKRYRQKKKEEKERNREVSFEAINIEAISDDMGPDKRNEDPLCSLTVKVAVSKIRYRELKKRKALMKIIAEYKKKDRARCNVIRKLKEMLREAQAQIVANNTTSSTLLQESDDNISIREDQENLEVPAPTTVFDCMKQFYLSDANSIQSADKKEFITRDRVRMQKRYLHLPLKQLHQIFLSEHKKYKISYSFFCKHRPFWVVFPREVDRDICQCSSKL